MKTAFHIRTPGSIVYFSLMIPFVLLLFTPVQAFDIKQQTEVTIQGQSSDQIQFKISLNLENVLYTWMGTDLFVICGAAYGDLQEYDIIGEKTVEGALSAGDFSESAFFVPITQFNSKPVGKTPDRAYCLVYAKKGSQCTALGIARMGISGYGVPSELESLNCDDITLPGP